MSSCSPCALTFQGDGTTTVFPFTFQVPSALDLQVTLTDATQSPVAVTILQPSLYSISGIGNPAGGSVTYPLSGAPLAAGWTLSLRPAVQVPIGCGTDPSSYLTTILTAENAATAAAAACSATASAAQAATSANAAQGSALAAAGSAGNAAGSASAAATSAADAASAVNAANTAAGNAASSATAASASATNAATSAAAAASSAGDAASAAANAGTSATTAANSASSAGNSSSAAASSAADASAAAAVAQAAAAAMSGTSATALAIGTGAQTFATQAAKYFNPGTWLMIASAADPANYMHGQVTAYSGTTLSVNVTDIGGSGTHADWIITVSGTRGAEGALGQQGLQGATGPQGAQGPAGPGSVVSITAGNGLAGGTITTSGTLAVQAADSTVVVDGSGVRVNTGSGAGQIAGSADIVALQQDVIQNYLLDAVNGAWAAGQYSNGGYDAFNSDTLSGVSGTSGQTYVPADRIYTNTGPSSRCSYSNAGGRGGRTAAIAVTGVGNWLGTYPISQAVNGITIGSDGPVPTGGNTSTYSLTFDFGAGASKVIQESTIYMSSNPGGSWQWQGSNDLSVWTNLGDSFFLGNVASQVVSLGNNTTGYRYYRFQGFAGTVLAYGQYQEFEFKIADAPLAFPDMTLVPAPLNPPPATAPAQALLTVLWRDLSGYSRLNTDFTAEITQDGGTTWVPATLANTGLVIAGFGVLTATVPLSGSGTTVQYRLKTLNNREQQVKAVGLMTQ